MGLHDSPKGGSGEFDGSGNLAAVIRVGRTTGATIQCIEGGVEPQRVGSAGRSAREPVARAEIGFLCGDLHSDPGGRTDLPDPLLGPRRRVGRSGAASSHPSAAARAHSNGRRAKSSVGSRARASGGASVGRPRCIDPSLVLTPALDCFDRELHFPTGDAADSRSGSRKTSGDAAATRRRYRRYRIDFIRLLRLRSGVAGVKARGGRPRRASRCQLTLSRAAGTIDGSITVSAGAGQPDCRHGSAVSRSLPRIQPGRASLSGARELGENEEAVRCEPRAPKRRCSRQHDR